MATSDLILALLSLDAYDRGSYLELQWGNDVIRPGLGAPTWVGNAQFNSERDRETFGVDEFLGASPVDAAEELGQLPFSRRETA